MHLQDLSRVVRSKRRDLGMSQDQLAKITDLSRQTIIGLEQGTLGDLGFEKVSRVLTTLGIALIAPPARQVGGGLWMAARSASVSYRGELSAEMLANALATTQIPAGFRPHVAYFLDEAPIELIVRAVEETAIQFSIKPRKIWGHVASMAKELASPRAHLWS